MEIVYMEIIYGNYMGFANGWDFHKWHAKNLARPICENIVAFSCRGMSRFHS